MDGFFSDGALLLIHDAELRGLLDGWVAGLDEQEFVECCRWSGARSRTFSRPERRTIAEPVVAGADHEPAPRAGEELDSDAGGDPRLATVELMLGIGADVDEPP